MYSDDGVGDGGLQAALMRNLVGLVDMQARCVLPHTGPPHRTHVGAQGPWRLTQTPHSYVNARTG